MHAQAGILMGLGAPPGHESSFPNIMLKKNYVLDNLFRHIYDQDLVTVVGQLFDPFK
jgi:hypothetical protein